MIDTATTAHVLTIIATAPPAMKVIESDAWSNPRTWVVVVFLLLIATWREWFGAIKSLFVARRTSEITEQGKDNDKDRSLESTLFQHVLEKEKKATQRATLQTQQTIETLKATIDLQIKELKDVRAERDQAQVDLKVEMHHHNETRVERDKYRHERNNLRHMLSIAKQNIDNDFGDGWTLELEQMLELADEASSVQTGKTVRSTLPTPPVRGDE